jgi:8-oxo-dGTP pyrophosphatase MutT (NUDIX family)
MPTTKQAPRIGARVLLLDNHDRVLLIHARDPDNPTNHWWELPGGGQDPGEALHDTARRELAEETGIQLTDVGAHLWTRESRFHYRGRDHHRVDHVFLVRTPDATPTVALRPTDNEKAGLVERRWWTVETLAECPDTLLPATLPQLFKDIVNGWVPPQPLTLADETV